MPETNYRNHPVPEWSVVGAIWRWSLPIALVTGLAAAAVWYFAKEEPPIYPVQTELLVRIGYEYSPVPFGTVSETQQINFRADEVIGTEIHIISGSTTIQKALQAAPHPEITVDTDGNLDALQIELAREKLSVKRLEGSNVILVQVTDPDPAWATAFLQALVSAYFDERERLFSQEPYGALLDTQEADTLQQMANLDGEARAISTRIALATGYLTTSATALTSSPSQPELRVSLTRQILELRVLVDAMGGIPSLTDALDALDRALAEAALPVFDTPTPPTDTAAPTTAPAGTTTDATAPAVEAAAPTVETTPGTLISSDLLDQAINSLASDAARLNAIKPQREYLLRRLEAIRTAQLRKDLRDEVSDRMTVMTPPHQLGTPNGLARAQKPALGGLIALTLSTLFFVYIDGLRRLSVRRRENA